MSITQEGSFSKWECKCGATGTAPDREQARNDLKEHRAACSVINTSSTPPQESKAVSTETTAAPKAKASAKKTAAKADAKKGGRKKRESSITEVQAKQALARLQKGETSLIAESKKLGFTHNGPLRAALRALVGAANYGKLFDGKKVPPKAAAKKTAAKKPAARKRPSTTKAKESAPAAAAGTEAEQTATPPAVTQEA